MNLAAVCRLAGPILFAVCTSGLADGPMVMDGRFDDWADIEPVVAASPAPESGSPIRFGKVWVTHDTRFVYLRFQTGAELNLQKLPGSVQVLFDLDADATTGRAIEGLGADFVYAFTPIRDGRPTEGQGGVQWVGSRHVAIGHGALEAMRLPTYATPDAECRIARGYPMPLDGRRLFDGGGFKARLVAYDANARPCARTPVFEHRLGDVKPVVHPAIPIARPKPPAIRLVAYNVLQEGLLKRPAVFARILRVLDPDILGLTELDAPADAIAEALAMPLPGKWNVVAAARTAIASRWPVVPIATAAADQVPADARRVRVVLALVRPPAGQPMVVACIHLTSGGAIGDRRDRARDAEATLIASMLREVRNGASRPRVAKGTPIVVCGDFNTVGSDRSLRIFRDGSETLGAPDWDGSALTDAHPLQVGGRSSATWRDDRMPFGPGRLDFVLYADSAIKLAHGFVLNTADLSDAYLAAVGLLRDDTLRASDHCPVVVDLAAR